jgi:hypothetical protein
MEGHQTTFGTNINRLKIESPGQRNSVFVGLHWIKNIQKPGKSVLYELVEFFLNLKHVTADHDTDEQLGGKLDE